MDFELVTTFERLCEVEREWNELLPRSSHDVPTLSPLWLKAWWRVFGNRRGRQLRTILFWENNRLVGIAPLLSRAVRLPAGVSVQRLELLASGESERNEICSDYIGIIAERGVEQRLCRTLVHALRKQVCGPWDDLLLTSLDATRVLPAVLSAELAPTSVSYGVTGTCPYIPLPKSWDDYLAALPPSSRYMVRRSLRDFEKWTAGDFELTTASTIAELESARRVLEQLHRERWRSVGKPGVFESVRFRAFHDQVMPELLRRGVLELSVLSARGRPIAALYNIAWSGRVLFYQGGRTLELPKQIRAGIVGHALAIQRAIEQGRSEYDFLAGTARYKLDLALEFRPISTLHATTNPLIPRVQLATRYLGGALRRIKRRFVASRPEAAAPDS